MKRTLLLTALAAALAACADQAPTGPAAVPDGPALSIAPGSAYLDPALSAQLAAAAPTDRVVAIVNFDPTRTSADALAAQVQGLGAGVIRFRHLSLLVALATPSDVAAIAGMGGVDGVFANGTDRVLLRESTASIRADRVWASGTTGAGIGVAIMDSGINGLNPDVAFPAKTVANVKFVADLADVIENSGSGTPHVGGTLYVENLANTDVTSGHGTHVAGIVGGSGASTFGAYRGVAPGVDLVGLSVGEGLSIVNVSVLLATDWLLENGARYNVQVVNCSWGSNGDFNPLDPVNEAMSELHDAGMTVVFAAGNEGPDMDTMNRRSVNPDVISVAAGCKLYVTDPTNTAAAFCQDPQGRAAVLADFSSRGRPGSPLWHPDVTAPGVRIVSTRSPSGVAALTGITGDARSCNLALQHLQNYVCLSGTSMSAPHVAGVAALMEEATGGRITPDQTLQILSNTARPLAGYALWEVGTGFVDAEAAVAAARQLP
jgi:serine protease AprX